MNKFFSLFLFVSTLLGVQAQSKAYTTYQLHSHNDYDRATPFFEAVNQNFGSIEADIWMADGKLKVCHNREDIPTAKELEVQYIAPIVERFRKNRGKFYAESKERLQLLVDLKTSYQTTLQPLIDLLKKHPKVFDASINPLAVRVVVSGAIPPKEEFAKWSSIVLFDGRVQTNYTAEQLTRIGLISDSFRNYSQWNGSQKLSSDEFATLKRWVYKVHASGKPIRFWATPDTQVAWAEMMRLGVDYINTDQPAASAAYIRSLKE